MESVNPSAYMTALGSTFVRELTDQDDGAALRIGGDVYSKHDVATRLGVVHTRACSILSTICRRLKVASVRELYDTTSPYTFAEFPAGVTTLYVMFQAFRDKDLDVDAWYARGQNAAIVSFFALKHREQRAAKRTRDDQSRRARRSRDRHHRHVATRYVATT